MSMAFVPSSLSVRSCTSTAPWPRDGCSARLRLRRGSYSIILFALSREGIAGVWGVCGEMGFPGDDAVEKEVPATIGGTLESWRLDEEDDRCSIMDEETESDRVL
jgi:hypothetical protein